MGRRATVCRSIATRCSTDDRLPISALADVDVGAFFCRISRHFDDSLATVTGMYDSVEPACVSRMRSHQKAALQLSCPPASSASSRDGGSRRRKRECHRVTFRDRTCPACPRAFEDHAAMLSILLAVAYQADLTRVFTFIDGARGKPATKNPVLKIPETHHDVSHHGNQPEKMALHAKIDTHFASLFAAFIRKTADVAGWRAGRLLDHVVVFGAGMSDGRPTPPIRCARGDWRCRKKDARKSFLGCEGVDACRHFWLSVAECSAGPLEQFGESNGRVEL